MSKLKELKELKRLLIKYLPDFDPYTDCREKWLETTIDDLTYLLNN